MIQLIRELNSGAIRFLKSPSNRIYLILLSLLFLALLAQAIIRLTIYDKADFDMFLDPAIDARFNDKSPFEFWRVNSYTPFFYCVMTLFTPFNETVAIILWTILSFLCVFWTIGIVQYLINGRLPEFDRRSLIAPLALILSLIHI